MIERQMDSDSLSVARKDCGVQIRLFPIQHVDRIPQTIRSS
jgi:hypothetical protein